MYRWLARGIEAVFCVIFPAALAAAAERPDFSVPTGQRQLFVDDHGVAEIRDLVRTLHQPDKKGAVIRPNPSITLIAIQTRSAPVWDPTTRLYRFWDVGNPNELHSQQLYCGGYHESKDGLHWYQPVVGQIEHRGSRDNNFVSVVHKGRHGRLDCVIYVPDDSQKPLKGLSYIDGVLWPFVSADGKQWQVIDTQSLPTGDEFNLSYDPVEKQYLATVKVFGRYGRSVGLFTSRDFAHWKDHGLVLQADDEDQERGRENIRARLADPSLQQPLWNVPEVYNVDVYNMGVFRYEGLYLGMPAMYHAVSRLPKDPNTEGFHLVQLVASRDLKNWERLGDRQPFLGPSPKGAGAYDLMQIIGPSAPVAHGDELWFYYTGIKYRADHRDCDRPMRFEPDIGAVCLAVLRRDGFISLDAQENSGKVLTQPFVLPGGSLHVNADLATGGLQVELLAADGKRLARSARLTGDLLQGRVSWAEGDPTSAAGQPVRLRLTLQSGRLYAYWFQ